MLGKPKFSSVPLVSKGLVNAFAILPNDDLTPMWS